MLCVFTLPFGCVQVLVPGIRKGRWNAREDSALKEAKEANPSAKMGVISKTINAMLSGKMPGERWFSNFFFVL